jgi:hypothetical protein
MTNSVSSPPRIARRAVKRPAIHSPPNPSAYNRNQSEIALSWWAKKKDKLASLKQQVSSLSERVRDLENEVEVSRERVLELEAIVDGQVAVDGNNENVKKVVKAVECNGGFCKVDGKEQRLNVLGALLLSFLSIIMRHSHPITRLRVITDTLFSKLIFGAEATATVLDEVYEKYVVPKQRRIFLPWKILQAIDLTISGSLNFNGVEVMRSVENLGRYERGILPSRSQIQRASYELHRIGQEIIPFERRESELGEMFSYDYEKLLRFILKTFQLHDIATRQSVEICMTLDGAELCDGMSHITAGIKITDRRAIDPRDGSPLSSAPDGVVGRIFKVQSRNYCFAFKSLLGKDCKHAYKEFGDFFQFFERLKREGLPESQYGPRLFAMDVWSPQDLSSIWKSLNTGSGARKQGNTYFCHVCPCTGNTIARYLVEENRYSFSCFVLVLFTLN